MNDKHPFSPTTVALVDEARQRVRLLSDSLPTIIDAGSFRTKDGAICRSKAPTIALSFREAQAWRVEEFSRTACDLIDRKDIVAGVANVRHAFESCAAIWYLHDLIETHIQSGIDHQRLYDKLGRLFVGSKKIFPEMPRSINVLDFIDKLDKKIPGARRNYDRLSEISHPNWAGSAAIYSNRTDDNFTTFFGRDVRDNSATIEMALNSLIGALQIFEYAYNRITDQIDQFSDACDRSVDN